MQDQVHTSTNQQPFSEVMGAKNACTKEFQHCKLSLSETFIVFYVTIL